MGQNMRANYGTSDHNYFEKLIELKFIFIQSWIYLITDNLSPGHGSLFWGNSVVFYAMAWPFLMSSIKNHSRV